MPTLIHNVGVGVDWRAVSPIYNRTNRFYRTSACSAQLLELNGGGIDDSDFAQGTVVPVLLYLSDYPAKLRGESRYNDVTHSAGVAWNAGRIYQSEDCAHAPRVDVAPFTQVLTTTQTTIDIGGLVRGTTPTNGVATYGYMIHINVTLREWENDDQATHASCRLILDALANAAVIDCPVVSGGAVAPGPSFPLLAEFPIILREQDYTQAMRDAGDVFTDANGFAVRIVGLHDVSATQIPG